MQRAEKHILDDEAEARAYFDQLWAEAMYMYRIAENPAALMKFSKEMESRRLWIQKLLAGSGLALTYFEIMELRKTGRDA